MTTNRQKAAVQFTEKWTGYSFREYCTARFGDWRDGYMDNFRAVSDFLSMHLEDAKDMYDEIACEHSAYMWDCGCR